MRSNSIKRLSRRFEKSEVTSIQIGDKAVVEQALETHGETTVSGLIEKMSSKIERLENSLNYEKQMTKGRMNAEDVSLLIKLREQAWDAAFATEFLLFMLNAQSALQMIAEVVPGIIIQGEENPPVADWLISKLIKETGNTIMGNTEILKGGMINAEAKREMLVFEDYLMGFIFDKIYPLFSSEQVETVAQLFVVELGPEKGQKALLFVASTLDFLQKLMNERESIMRERYDL